MRTFDCDVVIIGAGFAGAAAASVLAQNARRCIVLEAGDRVGGRAYTHRFSDAFERLEFGGEWVAPTHRRVRHYASLLDTPLVRVAPVEERRRHDGTKLHGFDASLEDDPDPALTPLFRDADRLGRGERHGANGLPLRETCFSDYLASLRLPAASETEVRAFWTITGNGDPDVVSAAELLRPLAGLNRLDDLFSARLSTIAAGSSSLVERMFAHAGAPVELARRVRSIAQYSSGTVLVTTDAGREVRARAALVAVPLNVLGGIQFSPALSADKVQAIATGHVGSGWKLWMRVAGVKPGILATGGRSGIRFMHSVRAMDDDDALVVGFALAGKNFDPKSQEDIAVNVMRFFPEGALKAWKWHDWVDDRLARGTWAARAADTVSRMRFDTWKGEGHIAFASGDFETVDSGTFEAAIASGERAARALLERL